LLNISDRRDNAGIAAEREQRAREITIGSGQPGSRNPITGSACSRCERPRCVRAGEKRDELALPDHSTTSSARASTVFDRPVPALDIAGLAQALAEHG
jgi:hypothetical protein